MIVVGDVHGCFKTLMKLLDKIPNTDNICFVGDLIDRGKDSNLVVDFVRKNNHKCVLGNHELMAIEDEQLWLSNGGLNTVKSYENNLNFHDDLKWFDNLPIIIEYEKFIISHSRICGVWDLDINGAAFIDTALWGRKFNDESKLPEGNINIFGHTPHKDVVEEDDCIDIDTACVFGYKLTAIDLDTGIFYEQKNVE